MNRIFRLLFILMSMTSGLFIAVAAHPYPYVELNADRTDFGVGDIFDVHVVARGVTDIDPAWGPDAVLGFGFNVHYASQGHAFNGAAMGPGFDVAFDTLPADRVAGIASPLNADSLFGDKILLANLKFECLSVGLFLLEVTSDPGELNGGLLTWLHHQDISAGLEVNVAPVPIPMPHFLLASGFIAIAFCRWARRES